MEEHKKILRLAAQSKLPDNISSSSQLSISVVRELVEAGYLDAIDASSFEGDAYLSPRITLAGREYLDMLEEKDADNQSTVKNINNTTGFMAAKTTDPKVWVEIENEYDISKRAFGKKMNFIGDKFKREIIFRDTEQAYLLVNYGFNKPAVVLAGGVIEELIRLYLDSKGVVPERNTLDSYIQACEDNGLLKTAIQKLADSVRQFRNIVHLERESSSRHSISKATAKGAVSSIFTISNDFEN